MDAVLGCQLLTRVVFHAQADIAGLLEAWILPNPDRYVHEPSCGSISLES